MSEGKVKKVAVTITQEDLLSMDKDYLTPAQVCAVVGGDPQWVRYTAREAPHELGYPVTVIRNRVKIPRIPFCKFMGWI